MRKQKNELYLVNLANQMIAACGLHIGVVETFLRPARFRQEVWNDLDAQTYQKFGIQTLAKIAAFARRKDVPVPTQHITEYRKIPIDDVWGSPEYCLSGADGYDMLHGIALNVIAGAIFEILATERVLRVGSKIGLDYKPLPKLEEFVKKVRLSRDSLPI